MLSFIIRRPGDGKTWQTAKGFVGLDASEATKYPDADEASKVIAFCVPGRARAVVERVES